MRRSILQTALIACAALPLAAGAADDRWGLCAGAPSWAQLPELPSDTGEAIRFTADHADVATAGLTRLTGNVEMQRLNQTLSADALTFDRRAGDLEAEGNVSLIAPELSIRGSRFTSNVNTGVGRFEDAEFFVPELHARGGADVIERPNETQLLLEGTTYTTCDEGKRDWLLTARSVRLDQENGEGTARQVVVRFMNVPFAYTPWISFPISDARKSGFLAPSIGNSDKRGFELEVPYYWNIAPNYDATISPRFMSDRGTQLNTEFRYLTESSHGDIQTAWLDDDVYDDERWLGRYRHDMRPAERMRIRVDANAVSDATYFDDLGTSLDIASATHLERRLDATYSLDYGTALLRLQGYQTIDQTLLPTDYPYERLPQLRFDAGLPSGLLGLDYSLNTEWVQFQHNDLVTGTRLDVMPGISLPLVTPGAFAIPSIKGRYTAYQLDDSLPADQREPDRSVSIFSLDSGLIFERSASQRTRQTLEPRLFYLYVPYKAQDDLPVFDTNEYDFSFGQLFREERFSGPDRVSDADQLTLALTTRFLDNASGRERFRASLGQILYFEDRRVTLPGKPVETREESDLAAELAATLGRHWSARGSLLWDPETEQTSRASTRIQYRRHGEQVINLGHRFRDDDFEQGELSFAWPVAQRWSSVGRWVYDIDNRRSQEAMAGLEYESCCWAARLVSRRYITDGGTEYNNGVYFQLVLKGFTSVGNDIEDLLEEGILGYELND